MNVKVVVADYHNSKHAGDLVSLLSHYANDPAGGAKPLSDFAKAHLPKRLSEIQGAFSILAYHDELAVGLVNCFQGFSTFQCKPLINIHDVIVLEQKRGHNIASLMLEQVEAIALQRGCCKLTLEILEGNRSAKKAYEKFGFNRYALDPVMGNAQFWEKMI